MFAPPTLIAAALLICLSIGDAAAQASPDPPESVAADRAPGTTSFVVENVTRAELWRFFAPFANGGSEPDYAFIGNRSLLGAAYDGRRWSLRGGIQYVRLENLPTRAIGPGLLGTGAAYFFQAAGSFSYQFYLRSLSATLASLDGRTSIEAGRLSLDEPARRDESTADTLARQRLSGRLLGDMRQSMYQRAWDGVRVRASRGSWRTTAVAVLPTQGTFEESANLPMDRVRVAAVDVVRVSAVPQPWRLQAFATLYRDTREVRSRPDNSGVPADGADVTIGTFAGSAVQTWPHGAGEWDALAWGAVQVGEWYGQSHRAASAVAEGGYRWPAAPWRPWLRAGGVFASGDGRPGDDRHGTFFPMLPSGDDHVASNTYALMNVVDVWAQARVSPHARVDLSTDLHYVRLAADADRWYFGSGPTERRGNYFGFLGRNTRGARTLGTIVEGAAEWRVARWWSLRAYLARFIGGDAVRAVFQSDRLTTGWLESTIRF